ncbi:MAG: MGMT family protein [Acidobacteriota bacterium]|nr:MGMT family protein [Acidobacteriota bacterium]
MTDSNTWEEVYEIVRLIPPGRVMSYGQVATLCTRPLTPRAVGWALHGCPADVPWHRVVNASGGCSTDRVAGKQPGRQQKLLEAEGIDFSPAGTLDMNQYPFELAVDDINELLVDTKVAQ